MSHTKCEIFAAVRASELTSRVGGAQIRNRRQKLCRFVSQMVGFMAIRVATVFARMDPIWACLVPCFHEFLALRALSGELQIIAYDSQSLSLE